MSSVVYWIHCKEHTDMFTQGYVGITKHYNKRLSQHKKRPSNPHLKFAISKYGWDNLIKEVILIAEESYCLLIESLLRSKNTIGWNIAKGGGQPLNIPNKGRFKKGTTPWNKGVTWSEETKQKISKNRAGKKHTPEMQKFITENNLIECGKNTRFVKGYTPWNKGLKMKKDIENV